MSRSYFVLVVFSGFFVAWGVLLNDLAGGMLIGAGSVTIAHVLDTVLAGRKR